MYYKIMEGHYAAVVLTKEESQLITSEKEDTEMKKAFAFGKFLYGYCGIDKHPILTELSISLFESGETVYIWFPENFYERYGIQNEENIISRLEGFLLKTYISWQQVFIMLPSANSDIE